MGLILNQGQIGAEVFAVCPHLSRHRDRLPEHRQAIDEKTEADCGDHRELPPDVLESAATIDDDLREAHEMTRRQKESYLLQPFRLTFNRRVAAGKQL